MAESADFDLKNIVQAFWRRRLLLVVPMLLLVPLSFLIAAFAPKTYVAKSLILLQEEGRDNPLAKAGPERSSEMRERIAGLEALAKSDLVISRAMNEILGEAAPRSAAAIAEWKEDMKDAFSVELIGTDFVALSLKSNNPTGLGDRVAILTTIFLEALLTEEQTISATQLLLTKRKEEFEAAEREYYKHRQETVAEPDAVQVKAAQQRASGNKQQLEKARSAIVNARATVLKTGDVPPNIGAKISEITSELRPYDGVAEPAPSAVVTARVRLKALLDLQKAMANEQALTRDMERLKIEINTDNRAAADVKLDARLSQAVREARDRYDEYSKRYIQPPGRTLGILTAPERIRVIDLPSDPQLPVSSGGKYVIAGFLGSLGVALGLVVIAELMDRTVRRARDFETIVGAPVVTRLP